MGASLGAQLPESLLGRIVLRCFRRACGDRAAAWSAADHGSQGGRAEGAALGWTLHWEAAWACVPSAVGGWAAARASALLVCPVPWRAGGPTPFWPLGRYFRVLEQLRGDTMPVLEPSSH